jgi:N-acetyl-1-D-myo-inositol-2-amino-2-deoxy-alpha-D-glucopyranoside deacetylase
MVIAAGERMLVIVAHPDDETFGCGSTIACASSIGAEVTVVCCTRGEAGELRDDPELRGCDLATVREAELLAAAELLGVTRVEVLDHRDSGFDGPTGPDTLCGADARLVAEQFAHFVEQAQPHVVLVLDGSDGHRDHLRVRELVEQVLRDMSDPPRLFRSCLARSVMRDWVAEMRSVRPDTVYLELDPDTLGAPDEELVSVDVSDHLATREAAIALHRSQISPFDGLSPRLRRAFLATDHLAETTLR